MGARECRSILRSVVSYVDGELDSMGRRAVDDHLRTCAECRREMEQLRQVTRLIRGSLSEGPGADARWREALARAKRSLTPMRPGRRPLPGFFPRVLRHPLGALAAMIVLSVAVAATLGVLGLEEEGLRLVSYILALGLT